MKKGPVERAFILAAGRGTRLRPFTDRIPKPMVRIAGKPIIDYALDALDAAGVQDVVVNLNYKGEVLDSHLKSRKKPKIILSWEKSLLDTGGGVRKTLDFFQNTPFYILNGDALWQDGPDVSALERLAGTWDPVRMDILLLLHPAARIPDGSGDYDLLDDGQARRSSDKTGALMFAGIRIAHPRVFEGSPEGAFSFLTLMDRAQENGRLYGLIHDGLWHHISTPGDLARTDAAFRSVTTTAQDVP
ncbi:MAG: nucleotidyltransferase family protein [Rhodospirillales bacterium]|nr:nucleotidyltransferase family protein [Rhodospirillales bacterium]